MDSTQDIEDFEGRRRLNFIKTDDKISGSLWGLDANSVGMNDILQSSGLDDDQVRWIESYGRWIAHALITPC